MRLVRGSKLDAERITAAKPVGKHRWNNNIKVYYTQRKIVGTWRRTG
jgi:hypothetical protein